MREPVEKLIEQYQKHIFAAAFSVCQNVSDADDVVQDTFLKYRANRPGWLMPKRPWACNVP